MSMINVVSEMERQDGNDWAGTLEYGTNDDDDD